MPGVGKSTMQALLRREVLHVLATKPTPFSKVMCCLFISKYICNPKIYFIFEFKD